MSNNNNNLKSNAINEWKELGIDECMMEFSCGGDSMNDWNYTFVDKDGTNIEDRGLTSFFDDEVFKRVDFYVNSDGHYQGEAGTVYITLNDEGDDFCYDKEAESEFSESHSERIETILSDEQIKLLKNKVVSMRSSDWESIEVVYKNPCILSQEDEELIKDIDAHFTEVATDCEFQEVPDHWEDNEGSWNWEFDCENPESWEEGNKVFLAVTKQYIVYKPSEEC